MQFYARGNGPVINWRKGAGYKKVGGWGWEASQVYPLQKVGTKSFLRQFNVDTEVLAMLEGLQKVSKSGGGMKSFTLSRG